MKKILKKAVATALAIVSALSLCSCSTVPFDYELSEYLTPADYTKIEIDEEQVPIRAEQYKTDLINAHSKKSAEPIFGRRHRVGDIAVISYKCYTEESLVMPIGEETPVALEDTGAELVIGRGKYLPAIESAILNTENFTVPIELHLILPTDFGITALAGKNVVFYLTVSAIYEFIPPTYDNTFIMENTRYSTVEEYEAAMLIQARRDLVWEAFMEQSEVLSYPKTELNEHTLDFIEYYTNQATAASLTLEQFVARKFFMELSTFHLKADEYSKNYTKEELSVYYIARHYGLELTDEEYEKAATGYANYYGYETLSEYEGIYGRTIINYTILKEKVMKYVTERSLSANPPQDSEENTEAA